VISIPLALQFFPGFERGDMAARTFEPSGSSLSPLSVLVGQPVLLLNHRHNLFVNVLGSRASVGRKVHLWDDARNPGNHWIIRQAAGRGGLLRFQIQSCLDEALVLGVINEVVRDPSEPEAYKVCLLPQNSANVTWAIIHRADGVYGVEADFVAGLGRHASTLHLQAAANAPEFRGFGALVFASQGAHIHGLAGWTIQVLPEALDRPQQAVSLMDLEVDTAQEALALGALHSEPSSGRLLLVPAPPVRNGAFVDDGVWQIYEDAQGKQWYASFDGGYFSLDGLLVRSYEHQLPWNSVVCLRHTSSGLFLNVLGSRAYAGRKIHLWDDAHNQGNHWRLHQYEGVGVRCVEFVSLLDETLALGMREAEHAAPGAPIWCPVLASRGHPYTWWHLIHRGVGVFGIETVLPAVAAPETDGHLQAVDCTERPWPLGAKVCVSGGLRQAHLVGWSLDQMVDDGEVSSAAIDVEVPVQGPSAQSSSSSTTLPERVEALRLMPQGPCAAGRPLLPPPPPLLHDGTFVSGGRWIAYDDMGFRWFATDDGAFYSLDGRTVHRHICEAASASGSNQ